MAFTGGPWKAQSDHTGLTQTGIFTRRLKTHLRFTIPLGFLSFAHFIWEVWPGGVFGKSYVVPK